MLELPRGRSRAITSKRGGSIGSVVMSLIARQPIGAVAEIGRIAEQPDADDDRRQSAAPKPRAAIDQSTTKARERQHDRDHRQHQRGRRRWRAPERSRARPARSMMIASTATGSEKTAIRRAQMASRETGSSAIRRRVKATSSRPPPGGQNFRQPRSCVPRPPATCCRASSAIAGHRRDQRSSSSPIEDAVECTAAADGPYMTAPAWPSEATHIAAQPQRRCRLIHDRGNARSAARDRCAPAAQINRCSAIRFIAPRSAAVVLEAFAQRRLLDLAGRGVRDFVDEDHVVGHPPFGDLALHEAEDVVLACGSGPASCTTTSSGRSSHLGWRTPITAASATLGWPTARFSRSIEEIHSPPDLITSLERSVICM